MSLTPRLGPGCPAPSALFTDLYELTMAQAYLAEGMNDLAVFELTFRELPPTRNYILACGLDDVLAFVENLRFEAADLDYLRAQGGFASEFLERLRALRFTGEVCAVPEGTVVFPNEPVVQVIAPMVEAQIIETYVLNQIHLQSVVAAKAARVVTAAAGRPAIDFGSRRAHGVDAALKVARASYIAGFAGTSNLLAGRLYGIPVFGTMAHSYIQAHDDEALALERFARMYPGTTLLVDTYDTIEGVRRAIELARRPGGALRFDAVRLDSGDLANLAAQSRRLLDEAGLQHVKLFLSSGLDEEIIAEMVRDGVPADAFGVGTRLAVSRDAPDLDFAYKLVEYAGRPCLKLSSRKVLLPGCKQVFRRMNDGRMIGDVIARHTERLEGEPLLVPVMREGRRLPAAKESLAQLRERARRQLEILPPAILALPPAQTPYPVEVSAGLAALRDQLAREHASIRRPA
jgi:nicotinate phosphoribosyltransferase